MDWGGLVSSEMHWKLVAFCLLFAFVKQGSLEEGISDVIKHCNTDLENGSTHPLFVFELPEIHTFNVTNSSNYESFFCDDDIAPEDSEEIGFRDGTPAFESTCDSKETPFAPKNLKNLSGELRNVIRNEKLLQEIRYNKCQ